LIVCVCYATAPFIANRKLADVPSLGVIAVSLTFVAVVYAPIAAVSLPHHSPRINAVLAVLGLAAICTGLAFVVFFRLIAESGPARAGLITFANPVVAIALGAVFLDEVITVAVVAGSVLVIAGCWLATRSVAVDASGNDEHSGAVVGEHDAVVLVPIVVAAAGGHEDLAQEQPQPVGVEPGARVVGSDDLAVALNGGPLPTGAERDGDLWASAEVAHLDIAVGDEGNDGLT
jgi:uncharacterized membrane protein